MNKFSIMTKSVMMAIGLVGIAHAGLNNWTGFYTGVNGGVAFNNIQLKSQQLGFSNLSDNYNTNSDYSTFFPGVQFGYMNQYPNNVVSGIEANFTVNVNKEDKLNFNSSISPSVYDRFIFRNQTQASIKGRIGRPVSWQNNMFLPYLTAGASLANLELTYKNEGSDYYSNHTTQLGWILGAGIEWAFQQKWSLRAEYYYANYGDAINLKIPSVYGLIDPNGGAHINLSSNNVMVSVNYWI